MEIGIFFGLLTYVTPSILAAVLKKRSARAIVALNLLTGWTGLGWIISLIWALVPDQPAIHKEG